MNAPTPLDLRTGFERDGYVGPVRAIAEDTALALAGRLQQELKAANFGPIVRRNRHFDIPEVRQIATSTALVELLTAIYSPDICLWRSHVFTGRPGRGLGWHADYFRTLLSDPLDHLTMHCALTEATADNCVMLVPGSHLWTEQERAERGFSIIRKTEDDGYGTPYYIRAAGAPPYVRMILRPGEFFIFHPGTLHASVDRVGDRSNASPAIGFAKGIARKIESRLTRLGAVKDPSRLAIGLRYCDPRNAVSTAAFAETREHGHCPVILAGAKLPQGHADWRR